MSCSGCNKNIEVKVPTKTPQLLPDGSIKFAEGPVPVIDGYAPSEDDPMLLTPNGISCSYRLTGITLQKDGTYAPMHVCRHSKCEYRSKAVTDKICEGCPLRELLN